jgi:hypothetical protein
MKQFYPLIIGCIFFAVQPLSAQTYVNFNFNQDPPVVANAGSSDIICAGDNANLSGMGSGGNGSFTYAWTPSGNVANPSNAITTANPSTTTVYTLTVSDGNNCSTTDTMVVTLPSVAFSVDAGSAQTICMGNNIILTANATGGYGGNTYDWSPGSIFSDSTVVNPTVTPGATVTCSVVVTDVLGCTTTDNVTITVIDCSGIEDENIQVMQAYPNPNNGSFTIVLNSTNGNDSYDVKISSVSGSIVYHKKSMQAGTYPVDLHKASSGIYTISVYNSGSRVFSQNIVIQ